jgi:hypothetical protein
MLQPYSDPPEPDLHRRSWLRSPIAIRTGHDDQLAVGNLNGPRNVRLGFLREMVKVSLGVVVRRVAARPDATCRDALAER